MTKKGFCNSCQFEGELIERADGKWFHDNPRCYWSDYRQRVREGFCYYCGFRENEISSMGDFIKRKDGKTFHGRCASMSS